MSDTVDPVKILQENLTDTTPDSTNATGKIPATPEGIIVAYGSIVVMALLPIFFGAVRSVAAQRKQKVSLWHTILNTLHIM